MGEKGRGRGRGERGHRAPPQGGVQRPSVGVVLEHDRRHRVTYVWRNGSEGGEGDDGGGGREAHRRQGITRGGALRKGEPGSGFLSPWEEMVSDLSELLVSPKQTEGSRGLA